MVRALCLLSLVDCYGLIPPCFLPVFTSFTEVAFSWCSSGIRKKNFSRSCTIRCLCLSGLGLVHGSSPFCSKNGISLVELRRSKIFLRDCKMIPWELCLKYKRKRNNVQILRDLKVSCEFLNNPIVIYKFPANDLFYFISFFISQHTKLVKIRTFPGNT